MKIIIFCALVAIAFAESDFLLDDDEEFRDTVACLVDKKPCKEDDEPFKSVLNMMLQDECSICTDEIKKIFKLFFDSFKVHAPEDYKTYLEINDPEDKYMKAFEKSLKN